MSVLDSIDTTVILEWPGRRTIGTLVEIDGYTAVLTALNAPTEGVSITVTVEGDTADEAIAIDGICLNVTETAWGEQRIEMEMMRVGTTCSASRLRDFVEEYGVASGGSVHIGASREQQSQRRFVYHVPERVDHVDASMTASGRIAGAPPTPAPPPHPQYHAVATGTRPVPAMEISEALSERRRSIVQTARNLGRPVAPTASMGEALPADSAAFKTDDFDGFGDLGSFDDDDDDDERRALTSEIDIGDVPDRTINSDLAAGAFITGGSLDEAFRDALRAVDRPKLPEQTSTFGRRGAAVLTSGSHIAMDAVPVDSELGRPVLPEDDLEPTRMLDAMPDEAEFEPDEHSVGDFTETDLSHDDVARLKVAIDDAIAHERDVADSEYHDPDEPIIVNTVGHTVPFAEPVQLGKDNRAPTMAQVAPARKPVAVPEPDPTIEPAASILTSMATSTARIERVAPSLAGALIAPKARKSTSVPTHKPSGSLERVQNLFAVDMAIRCDLPAVFQVGKKKFNGQLIRLAESRLRLQSTEKQPHLYQRMKVMLDPVDGGKTKITLNCEVTRIRETQQEGGAIAFDMRLSAGTNPPKEMEALRSLMQSFEAPSARASAETPA